MPVDRHDVAVIGAGIVGLTVARELLARNPGAKILVIDKADSVAQYQTGHNSGVIHAGVYNVPGLRRADASEISEIEPECKGVAALHPPATGIVDFAAVARCLERELRASGAQFALGCEITSLRRERDATVLTHATGEYQANW